ncbi:hypothetical protein VKI21_12525 [Cyanobacterium aponinum UTEX 3222]|uniref:hypothetical protein n=1 Tax=Cyanobacterium aponinum TaxID=379064 RepID=UPI002B4BB64C|nr:hypothetical protein [Cyanobacterium aponinum]WRL38820.1 hypothetical protein VKI22_01610 [Cyanobacterium aponinum UTEX 3221]WRL40884.1 hypothetical protein VKI21_12525 [Cyanobacterium aponinum UTEX 3222]
MIPNFYFWLLDNQCLFKHERFKPFIEKCIDDTNLFNLNSEREIYQYLWVNGYGESVLMAFLRLWYCYESVVK